MQNQIIQNKNIKLPIIILSMIAFFLPFERIPSFDIFGMTLRLSQLLFLMLLIYYYFDLTLSRKKINFLPIYSVLLAFVGIMMIGLLNSINLDRSIKIFLFTIFTMTVCFVMPQYIQAKDQIYKIIKIIFISTIIVCTFGIFQFLGDMLGLDNSITGLRSHYTKSILGFTRIQSTALEPLYFANFLLIPICLALSNLIQKKKKNFKLKNNFLQIGVLFLALLNLLLTSSRGGYFAFIFCFLLVCIYYFKNLFTLKKILTSLLLIISIYTVTLLSLNLYTEKPLQSTYSRFESHITNIFGGAAFDERLDTFKPSIDIFLEYPFVGAGIGSFGPNVANFPLEKPKSGWAIVNNETLELLAENGILGLIILSAFLYLLFLKSFLCLKHIDDPTFKSSFIALNIALLGILLQYQTFSTLYIMHIWFLIGLIISMQNITFQSKN